MRLNQIFLKSRNHARAAQNENKVPFKELKTLALENKISKSTKSNTDNKCLYEMSLLFKCWAENEFHNKFCDKYVQQLQNCYKNLMTITKQQKNSEKSDIPAPGSKNLTNKQYTYLLKQYPTV